MKKIIALVVFIGLIASCGKKKQNMLPAATGLPGDVYVIMDSSQQNGPLGKVIDSVFSRDMEVLNRSEPIFKLYWIVPEKLNSVLKTRRNLIFAFTLDQQTFGVKQIKGMFTPQSLNRIRTDSSFFTTTSSNLYASGQEVRFLVGLNEASLVKKIKNSASQLVEYFEKSEHVRIANTLFKSGQLKKTSEWMKKKYGVEIKIPFGYDLVLSNDEFIWIRQINQKDDRNIFIARKPYKFKEQFKKDSIISFRDEIGKKYIFGNPDRPETHIVTETGVSFKPVLTKETVLNKKYTVQMRGLWRTNTATMGGPFVSYTLVNEKQKMLYYVEGFLYTPNREQRELIRELESIITTFKPID